MKNKLNYSHILSVILLKDVVVVEEKNYYTDEEMAEILNLNISTVRFLCEKGDFENTIKNKEGKWIFPSKEIQITTKQSKQIRKESATFDRKIKKILNNQPSSEHKKK